MMHIQDRITLTGCTVRDLKKILNLYSDDYKVCICGVNDFYLHLDTPARAISFDHSDLADMYEDHRTYMPVWSIRYEKDKDMYISIIRAKSRWSAIDLIINERGVFWNDIYECSYYPNTSIPCETAYIIGTTMICTKLKDE